MSAEDAGAAGAQPIDEPEVGMGPPVSVEEDAAEYTITNEIVTARISKTNGNLLSLQHRGQETIRRGYWSHDTQGGMQTLARVTLDPQSNGGDRAEVSIKAISGGIKLGHGPGAEEGGDIAADIEIRYSIGRGEPGIYTYSIFDHLPEYGADILAEARFAVGLPDHYDWISVDEDRNRYYPEPVPSEDKYAFTANQYENRAYGYSSTTEHVGFWLINPTIEYLSGGPTKAEFLCHLHTDASAAPVVLNYWRSSHYGGANVAVEAGEHWTKVIGPFYLYVNAGMDAMAMWDDAKAQAIREERKWPYGWVAGVDYPTRDERSAVRGTLVLSDPQMPAYRGKLMVGLAHPTYMAPSASGGMRQIDWQLNAKHYQFWVRVDDQSGAFEIPDVRPGTYSLHAFADGVLGEFVEADVSVTAAGAIDLGSLQWTPVRRGQQLWEIGVADRTAKEFVNGERYFEPTIPLEYAKLFPNDVHFTIGESDERRDWYFQHIPHDEAGTAKAEPYKGIVGEGRATPFAIDFDLSAAPTGRATLRLAIVGTGAKQLEVSVNGRAVGPLALGVADGAIALHQIHGIWYERELTFDAAFLTQGKNQLTLTVPAGPINNGVIYDYLRLELDAAARP